ncbi:MAG: toll/interleukin-1 receptor domain-containing protein [Anaerolineae bacterium]|jgi:hypothetical protein|nr:toll/interleukin-1 receptor domain-containing protein [Anaerolineae bacterium]
MRPQNVFLSSPDPQSDTLADFRAALMKQGMKVFTNDGISPDSDLARNEIAIADCFVVGLVESESQSDRFHKEISHALDAKKQIIVVQLEGDDIPQRLQNYAVIDMRKNFDMGLQLVAIAISGRAMNNTPMPMPNTPMSAPVTSPTTSSVPTMLPKQVDAPIPPPRPLTPPSSSPISQEASNPAIVIAVMFAIVLIGFIVLTNLPTGNRGSNASSNVSERNLSGNVVEFSTNSVSIRLPNSWQNSTGVLTNNRDIQRALGLSQLDAGSIQMMLTNRTSDDALFIMTYPLSGVSLNLAQIRDAVMSNTADVAGITVENSRLRSYSFGDAVYVALSLQDGSTMMDAHIVVTMRQNYLYMVLFAGGNISETQFNATIQSFEIVSDAAPVW